MSSKFFLLIWIILTISSTNTQRIRKLTTRSGPRFQGHGTYSTNNAGLWPNVFNVATKAAISANATCGEHGREEFCRLAPGGGDRGGRGCGVCDLHSADPHKRHPVHYAIDGTNRWWQSPTKQMGAEYERVAITLDLRQVYHVVYIILKMANSPRPGVWVLERSLDGEYYYPWQYHVTSERDCIDLFGLPITSGKPRYVTDTDVICTTFYSKLLPIENGEVHISLLNGRPGANETSPELLEFTRARYVRLLFLKYRATQPDASSRWLQTKQLTNINKRLYYSIRDITIGGQCVCNGHATSCRYDVSTGQQKCECVHGTCGSNCDRCCPLYNQIGWGQGTSRDARPCEKCQCFGHADECIYDPAVEAAGLSIDILGRPRGGGVCIDCRDFTTGVNCEKCLPGYYRPTDVRRDDPRPCISCECDPRGSISQECEQEPEHRAGLCICKPGYAGDRCDRCAEGYTGFPECVKCLCNERGTREDSECGEKCSCKTNVEGDKCDICKTGYFNLQQENIDGCTPCYCSGVSSVCEPAMLTSRSIDTLENWLVTDISVSQTVKPTLDTDTNWLSIGNYELSVSDTYYWLAPKPYLGNKLESYGSNLNFMINWFVMRGDTSGKPVMGPNIILVGSNGLRIAYGDDIFKVTNVTIRAKLIEDEWYHIPLDVKEVEEYMYKTDYKRISVTRDQFLGVLTDIKHILLRAKFHTDQIESVLQSTELKMGPDEDIFSSKVEKCSCPSGYTGLSCEKCDFGYVRIFKNVSAFSEQSICVKCNCNGHSEYCDTDGENCKCEHNTIGENCERCAVGYYGNPLRGTKDDCKKCACPLLNEENNFSPSCQLDVLDLDSEGDKYVCTQCPVGYTGDHCEICDYGYFGDPTVPGGKCQPCECTGQGPCDRKSGQCMNCRGNTEGWRCERCKADHYGDPITANCQPCHCDPVGSMGTECDIDTGQCMCKDRFTGKTCDKCQLNYGNITAGCKPCECHSLGSASETCDPITGMCSCKPGVEGFHCDACQHLHYGFSDTGCQSCDCHAKGSELATCDIVSGQCRCKPNVAGRKCDSCQSGYWGLDSGHGCTPCSCDPLGSVDGACDASSGQCRCKHGVGGLNCDSCLPGYFGFSQHGCSECKVCNISGHICDPDIGKCVCPPNTRGEFCELCVPNTWGHTPGKGCKLCNCMQAGSVKRQCNLSTGLCQCKPGFEGPQCDRCAPGHYGFPHCHKCDCHVPGTKPETCDSNGICGCSSTGQCTCKANVIGKHCDQCSSGTFGLNQDNPDGCTKCFCFGRTVHCTESNFTLGHIHLNTSRELKVKYSYDEDRYNIIPSPPNAQHTISKDLTLENDLLLIPGVYEPTLNIKIDQDHLNEALYWRLPKQFLGDQLLSYGGYLRFVTETIGGTKLLNSNRYPLVQIRGNNKIVLEYFEQPIIAKNRYEIRLNENNWRWKDHLNLPVTRDIMMIALQNVQHIFIRANIVMDFNKVILHSVTLDTAISLPRSPQPLAKGVELCLCPKEYNSSSCQNPSIGFYRWYNPEPTGSIIIDLTGEARPCKCNGRSTVCDIETGHCLNCTENTVGTNCQFCGQGYYGNPMTGKCKPCPCPSPDKKFSQKCVQLNSGEFKCVCKKGYTGPKCEKCEFGYYGNPKQKGGSCLPCKCNKFGSLSSGCHHETGQCECRIGIWGKDCSKCEKPRHILQSNGCTKCNNCTQWLLNDLDDIKSDFSQIYTDFMNADRILELYKQIDYLSNETNYLHDDLDKYIYVQDKVDNLDIEPVNIAHRTALTLKREHLLKKVNDLNKEVHRIQKDIDYKILNIEKITDNILDMIDELDSTGVGHVEVKKAIDEGNIDVKIIRQIFIPTEEFYKVQKYCKDIQSYIKSMKQMDYMDPKDIQQDLDDFRERLQDMRLYIEDTFNNVNEVEKHFSNISKRYNSLKAATENIKGYLDINGDLSYEQKVLKAKKNYEVSKKNYEKMMDSVDYVEDLLSDVENKIDESNQETELRRVLKKAKDHADMLVKLAKDYNESFNVSHEANLALRASKAYQEIIDLLNEAKDITRSTNETIGVGMRKIDNEDYSIKDLITIYMNQSDAIMTKAKKLQGLVAFLNEEKELLNISISFIRDTLWKTGLRQIDLDRSLYNNLTLDKRNIFTIIHNAIAISQRMSEIHKNSNNIKTNIQNVFQPALAKIRKGGDEVLSFGEEKLTEAERNIKSSKDILTSLESNSYMRKENLKTWNDTLSGKLYELKSLIQKAKLTAEGIRLSLSNKNNLPCYRSYKLNYNGPTTTTNLAFTLTLNSTDEKSTLLYLPTLMNDFIKVELINRNIEFQWNLGKDTGKISAPLKKANNNTWYRVEIERIANVAKMIVYSESTKNNPQLYYGVTNSAATIFDIGPTDKLWIGQNRSDDIFVTNVGLAGCLHDVTLDGKPIGLWNFISTSPSCTACYTEQEIRSSRDTNYYFSGQGYTLTTRDKKYPYRSTQTSIHFTFKTYDENALLFLILDVTNNRSASLSLKNGRVHLSIEYGGGSILELTTEEKHNTGTWTAVTAGREFNKRRGEMALLKVNEKNIPGTPAKPTARNSFPNLDESKFFIGGVPPEFHSIANGLTRNLHTHSSYLGCMSLVNVDSVLYSPMSNESYGIEPTCANKSIKITGFHGKGYVQMPGLNFDSSSSVGFVFQTIQDNALLMSGFKDISSNTADEADSYIIAIISGYLQARIKNANREIILSSNVTVNDGYYHVLSISKTDKNLIELRIDDVLLDKSYDTDAIDICEYVYFGGLPDHLQYLLPEEMAIENLKGTIKDVLYKNRLVSFGELINFEKAQIGRPGPTLMNGIRPEVSTLMMPTSPAPKISCGRIPGYSLEQGAVKLGDSLNSYVQFIFKSNNFWIKEFSIVFEFRTFYLNGLLFVSPGIKEKNNQFIMLSLRDNNIQLTLKGKRRKDITIYNTYNDGDWHQVVIKSVNRKITLTIDQTVGHGSIKLPRKSNLANMIYIGGIAANTTRLPEVFLNKIHPFRGCIRNFKVNNQKQDLAREKMHNVGQCFTQVEKGSYFAGDAYAIYKNKFLLFSQFELQFEFRTSEQNGVLLSIAEPNNKNSLSLELYNGAVIMMANTENKVWPKVKTNFSTEFALCDNKWHKVSAFYTEDEITVNVDGVVHSSLALNTTFIGNKFEGPLYIGGLPENAPSGKLHTRDNFKGCIRNIVIDRRIIDWTDMDELNHILLNSCPVINS